MNPQALHGLIAAPFTPFNGDASLALDRVPEYAAFLVAERIAGAFVCGTTGEGASLSVAERRQVAEKWVGTAPPALPVIVHVGHTSIEEACGLARHAQEIGAAAFAAHAPTFFRPDSIEDLVASCGQIAGAAPDLPFYYYHIPALTGVSLPCLGFLRLARERIPNLRGIKFTFENLMDFLACMRLEGGRYDIVFGRDEALLPALALGARGAVGSTYNYLAPLFLEVMKAFGQGNLERSAALQAHANRVIDVMLRHGGLPAGKAIMGMLGLELGPVRLPLRTIEGVRLDRLREDLSQLGWPGLRNPGMAEDA